MKFEEIDVVRLKKSYPEFGLEKGEKGTIVAAFSKPREGYMVEFLYLDEERLGLTKFDGMDYVFMPEELELVISFEEMQRNKAKKLSKSKLEEPNENTRG